MLGNICLYQLALVSHTDSYPITIELMYLECDSVVISFSLYNCPLWENI